MLSWVREKIAEGRLRWQQTSQQVRLGYTTTNSSVFFIYRDIFLPSYFIQIKSNRLHLYLRPTSIHHRHHPQ